jgi:hypothetical protein
MTPPSSLRRPRIMLAIVAFGLFVSGVTIWPWEVELELALRLFEALSAPVLLLDTLRSILADMRALREAGSFVLYIADWLAYAHLVLTALFLMAMKDPVRNILVVRFGILCCLTVPILAVTCIPQRGIPLFWIFIDSSFAFAAIPLWIALKDLRRLEADAG